MPVIPERIKQKRKALRYSQRGLAIEAGVPYHAVLNLEAGRVKKSPSYHNIVAIARVLQEPPEYFFDDVAVEKQPKPYDTQQTA